MYSNTRWRLQIDVCFTSELGEIINYNGFLAGGIDHSSGTDYPRVRSIAWKKVAFTIGFMTGFLGC